MTSLRTFIIAVFALVCTVLPVWAQESATEEPTQESLIQSAAIVTFPQMIYFEGGIALPAEQVARVILTIEAPGIEPVVVDYPQEKPFDFAKEFVIASYDWQLTAENTPHLFSEIRYTWRAVTPNEHVYENSATVEFTDNRAAWHRIDVIEDAINITYPLGMTIDADALARDTATSYEKLRENTQSSPSLKFLLYPENLPRGCNTDAEGKPVVTRVTRDGTPEDIPCDYALADALYRASNYNVFSLEQGQAIENELIQSIIDAFYMPIWSQADVPAWFQEGIRQLYLPDASGDAMSVSRVALRNDREFTLSQMLTQPEDPVLLDIWRAQSYGMTLYIAERNGVDTLFQLAREPNAAPSFAETYTQLTGKSLNALIADWQTWVYTRDAEAAYAYNIYLPLTPTPTMTFTPTITRTPLPPTDTPSPMPDYTPTKFPTPRIPRYRTPTITPLPEQSFSLRPTATPATKPIQTTSPVPGISLTQLAVLCVMAVLVMMIAYLGFGRRSR